MVNENHRVVGAVTVDDVLDHILPEDWRITDSPEVGDETSRVHRKEASR